MIGGNTTITIQISTTTKNAIGESVKSWTDVQSIEGWLDLSGGDSKYTTYDAKIQESTHVFISDYIPLDSRIKAENSRVVDEDGLVYDVLLLDDPMKLHKQWEIYLKFTGGQ
ncbi:phage head completion protein [Bacillus infantis]|uniref:phage head completion protein n=1 Tax=Bacillus infantis TaxID=324767 RepID=UPI003CF3926E